MTTMSQMFDAPDIQLNVNDPSFAEDSDDENRDEIKKLLEEGLENETFDYDSDSDDASVSKFSNHDDCSFVSNKEESLHLGNGNNNNHNVEDFLGANNVEDQGIFQTPKIPIGNGTLPQPKRVDFSALPNIIPSTSGTNGGQANFSNGNGFHLNGHASGDPPSILRSNLKVNGFGNNGGMENNQKNRETEEIEVQSPTISILHKGHCPKTGNEGLLGENGVWLETEGSEEQLKALCEFRERQSQRDKATVTALQKDKRALNHQIQLMKAEMVQMRSQCDDAEQFAQRKEDQENFLKKKLQEQIEENDRARKNESSAKNECGRLHLEIEKLQQEVQLLSSLGASAQQAELNDVVRQLQEKHARDIAYWQKLVGDLEGQLRTYKKSQQILHANNMTATKEDNETQTEFRFEEEIERRERELAVQEFQEEFGDCAEAFLEEIMNLPDREIVKRVRQEWKAEKDKLVNHYQAEIKIYQRKLAELPKELFQMWQKTQEELGLNKPPTVIKVCRNASTSTEVPVSDQSTSFNASLIARQVQFKDLKEEGVQVNFAALMANGKDSATDEEQNFTENKPVTVPTNFNKTSNSASLDEKETSSVIVQTDETLETYKILASLIDSWSLEVNIGKQRAEVAETRTKEAENELKSLNTKFQQLQKLVKFCRRDSRKQQEELLSKNAQMKAHYVTMLQQLSDKLEVVDQINVLK